jgi:FixJ family two-component response regulator
VVKSGKTICVVDDDPSVRKALGRLIRSSGFTVKTYGSARGCLNDAAIAEVDLLVIDVQMPGMSGLNFQRHLVDLGFTTPIVFITAYENATAKAEAMAAGAVAFLQKPFSEENLLRAIYRGLGQDTHKRRC